jgi:hypothetical protein
MPDWPAWGFEGTYAYSAGTGTATIDVPNDSRLRRVSMVSGTATASTVTIGGGSAITVPAGYAFDEIIQGAAINKDVTIAGGSPQAWYVAWAT